MTRYTRKDVESAFESVREAANEVGFPQVEYHLQIGSKTYGQAYRMSVREPGTGALCRTPWDRGYGYLGMTAGEACETLWTIRAVLYAVLDLRKEKP